MFFVIFLCGVFGQNTLILLLNPLAGRHYYPRLRASLTLHPLTNRDIRTIIVAPIHFIRGFTGNLMNVAI